METTWLTNLAGHGQVALHELFTDTTAPCPVLYKGLSLPLRFGMASGMHAVISFVLICCHTKAQLPCPGGWICSVHVWWCVWVCTVGTCMWHAVSGMGGIRATSSGKLLTAPLLESLLEPTHSQSFSALSLKIRVTYCKCNSFVNTFYS